MALARRLNRDLILYKTARFPYIRRRSSRHPYRCVIGIGGNIGDVRRRFGHLFSALMREKSIDILRSAPILRNPPFGFTEQADFYNSVMVLATALRPHALLHLLQRYENRFGRRRSFPNAPRTLDIDILFFDALTIESADLIVPHPHWHERQSVVIPLSYVGVYR